MTYAVQNDPGHYLTVPNPNPYYQSTIALTTPATQAYTVTPSASTELPLYAKELAVFVPSGTTVATVTVVFLNDLDTAPVTFSFAGPGNYSLKGFIRRVTAVTGTGVVVNALCH